MEDNFRLRVYASYLNAKVQYKKSEFPNEPQSISCLQNGKIFIVPFQGYVDINDCTLLLRSLNSMTKEEAKDFIGIINEDLWDEIEDYKDWLQRNNNEILKLAYHREADLLRSKNFITHFQGVDLIKAGIAKIDNKVYQVEQPKR